ncbi:hypothetical protein Tco_1298113, partial [Tanacetum coccineum]
MGLHLLPRSSAREIATAAGNYESLLTPGRCVKENLSEITITLTRQFWGVTSFLVPLLEQSQQSPKTFIVE